MDILKELTLPRSAWLTMRRQVLRCLPREACGLLAGRASLVEKVLPARNAERSPVSFRISPGEQWRLFQTMDRLELDLLAIYHSHPAGPAGPSPTDIQQAYYQVVHLIWSPDQGDWQAQAFWIEAGQVFSLELHIT